MPRCPPGGPRHAGLRRAAAAPSILRTATNRRPLQAPHDRRRVSSPAPRPRSKASTRRRAAAPARCRHVAVARQAGQRLGEGGRVAGRNDEPFHAGPYELAAARNVGDHQRPAAGGSLQHRARHAVAAERRHGGNVRRAPDADGIAGPAVPGDAGLRVPGRQRLPGDGFAAAGVGIAVERQVDGERRAPAAGDARPPAPAGPCDLSMRPTKATWRLRLHGRRELRIARQIDAGAGDDGGPLRHRDTVQDHPADIVAVLGDEPGRMARRAVPQRRAREGTQAGTRPASARSRDSPAP